jgi:hypothetical protein
LCVFLNALQHAPPRAHTHTHACALARAGAGAGVANHIVAGALRQREADLRAAFAAEAQAARLAHEAEKEALREVRALVVA